MVDKHAKATSETERRQHARMPVHWHGSLVSAGQEEDCLVLDISAGGARVQCSDPFGEASRITLRLAQGDRHDGSIVWRQGSFMGLQFAAA